MKKKLLIKMVELDGMEVKLIKFGEEITELRFALINGSKNNIIEEISQVNFIKYQLECVGKCTYHYVDEMLNKYNLIEDYRKYIARNWQEIKDREIFEYSRNLERLGLVD